MKSDAVTVPRSWGPSADVDVRLAALGPGLSQKVVREAVDRAVTQRNGVPVLAPAWYEGSTLNAETVANLMELLIPSGWRRGEERGFCTATSPDGGCRIAVATGDGRTGTNEFGKVPKTKNPKGAVTERAIRANTHPTLFDDAAKAGVELDFPPIITWFLLVAVVRQQVMIELSRPMGQDKLGRIDRWSERILLDPISATASTDMVGDEDGDEAEIDIDVPRRNK